MHDQTMEKLHAMKLTGMADAYEEQRKSASTSDLSFDDRFAMLVDRQWIWKENRALATRLKFAGLKLQASMEEVDYRHPRGLDRSVMAQLAGCDWITRGQNCLITGPTGAGKSYLACALAHKACREGYRALYCYAPRLFRELAQAQADGSLTRLLNKLARVDLLLVDDWGLATPKPEGSRLFLEVLDDRRGGNLITSQYPVEAWHELVGDPTVADAILDRLAHNAHHIPLKGESMRRKEAAA